MSELCQAILAHFPVAALSAALEGHSPNFQNLTGRLLHAAYARELLPGISQERIENLARLSVFHDIGKRAVPPAVLQKAGKLTQEEYALVQTHAAEGCKLLQSVSRLHDMPDFPLLCDICLHHHERWDGGGYPDGLRGSEISPVVQVVGLADAYDALVTSRPYKRALAHRQAADLILAGGCGAFDPQLMTILAEQNYYIKTVVYAPSETLYTASA